jgi:hypothetical protein
MEFLKGMNGIDLLAGMAIIMVLLCILWAITIGDDDESPRNGSGMI